MPYVCIHAHFYQPSREDPWTGTWPDEPTASPWRTWNDRISDECYAPNAAARLLDAKGRTRAARNTYAAVSADYGPTLLHWFEVNRPVLHQTVVDADTDATEAFGAGNAMAQGYHHTILPLATPEDRRTEIAWGVADFARRFGRPPQGFWMPEAAVDTPTLVDLADAGVGWVVLAPHQLEAIRAPGGDWIAPEDDPAYTHRPYRIALPSGRDIVAFPYDSHLARAVAFDGALHDGEGFGRRLLRTALAAGDGALIHYATDAESYGHHHPKGEMALARALEEIERHPDVHLTTYAGYLEAHPARWEARLAEETSWSCAHGIERWRSACPCGSQDAPGWQMDWRAPLRAALDALREEAFSAMADELTARFRDPVAARNAYVEVLGASPEAFAAWYDDHAGARPDPARARQLLEIQRHLLAMYMSCAWFFEDVSRIEVRQALRHGVAACVKLRNALAVDLGPRFLQSVEAIPANGHVAPVHAALRQDLAEPPSPPDELFAGDRFVRRAGLFCHVSSLPGDGPTGDLDDAPAFLDWMHDAGLRVWQVLPLCPVDRGGSPYASWNSFGTNPDLVGLRSLVRADLLSADEAAPPPAALGTLEPDLVRSWKRPLLDEAADRLWARPNHPWHARLRAFADARDDIVDAGLYRALKETHDERAWWDWPDGLDRRDPEALAAARETHREALRRWIAAAFFFHQQWWAIRRYATARGITLFGDLPIYVGLDSVEVWADQDLFELEDGRPTHVSGVPPDYFSETGQKWGNPLYDWEAMADNGYTWWTARIRRALELTDVVRLDHFIGFARYYAIPAHEPDARQGTWRDGPGLPLFQALERALGPLPLVAEDLGQVSDEVRELQHALGLPGMAVLQFSFDGFADNPHKPENHAERGVTYVGTHDNDTVVGWWNSLDPDTRHQVLRALPGGFPTPAWAMMRLALESRAIWTILTAQDLLGLGSEARLNTPGTTDGNWRWRMRPGALTPELAKRLRSLAGPTRRLPPLRQT